MEKILEVLGNIFYWVLESALTLLAWAVGIFLLSIVLYGLVQHFKQEHHDMQLQISGRETVSLFGNRGFIFRLWHQYPGNLKQGRVTVRLVGPAVPEGNHVDVYSFEEWKPNEENAIDFEFPLQDSTNDTADDFTMSIVIESGNAKTNRCTTAWKDDEWSKPFVNWTETLDQ